MCTVSVLYFCKGQWSKVVCKLAKGMWVQVFLLYFLADWICISQGAGLSVICSSRLNLHFSGYWAEYYRLPIANSWIVPLYAISELIGLQAGLFTVAFFFFPRVMSASGADTTWWHICTDYLYHLCYLYLRLSLVLD